MHRIQPWSKNPKRTEVHISLCSSLDKTNSKSGPKVWFKFLRNLRNSGPSPTSLFYWVFEYGTPFDSATSCAEKCPKINDLGRFFIPKKVVQNVVQVSSKLGLFLLLKNPLIQHVYKHFLMFFCGRCNLVSSSSSAFFSEICSSCLARI